MQEITKTETNTNTKIQTQAQIQVNKPTKNQTRTNTYTNIIRSEAKVQEGTDCIHCFRYIGEWIWEI